MNKQYEISYDPEFGYVYASVIDQDTGIAIEYDTFTLDPLKAKAFAEGYSEALNSIEDSESYVTRIKNVEDLDLFEPN